MAQQRKEHVRAAIVDAAARELAEAGFERATLASIAARAGVSVGNVYKYFPGKEALLAATVPPSFVAQLRALLRRRVEALGAERDALSLDAGHGYARASDEVLAFALAHRREVLFVLRHAAEPPYSSVRGELERHLVALALAYARRAYPRFVPGAPQRRSLRRFYRSFFSSICAVLEEEPRDDAAREAVSELVAYHLGGLRSFFTAASPRDAASECP